MPQENFNFEWKHLNSMDFGSYGLGASVSPMGSQLAKTNTSINWGVNNLELSMANNLDYQNRGYLGQLGVPEREELVRLTNLNRVNLSIHAPIVDPAGYSEGVFSESARQNALRELRNSIDFADQIGTRSNVKNVPVVIHAAHDAIGNPMPQERLIYVKQETGQVQAANPMIVVPDQTYWDYIKKLGLKDKYHTPEDQKQKGKWDYETLSDGRLKITPTGRLKMQNKLETIGLEHQRANADYWFDHFSGGNPNSTNPNAGAYRDQLLHINAELRYIKGLSENKDTNLQTPYVETEAFAVGRIADTISDLAVYAAKKESQPMIAVENWVPESVAGDPEQVGRIIKKAREEFVNKLTDPKIEKNPWRQSDAIKTAEKVIGINFDIGHANLWKKYTKWDDAEGKMVEYTNEDVKKWANDVYPYLKHVHLTDNFGDMDAHLPIGWGNAPIKEVLNDLKKRGWSGRAILETFGVPAYGPESGGMFGVAESLYQTGMPLIPGGPSWEKAAGSYFRSGYGFTGIPQRGGTYWPDMGYQGPHASGFSGVPYGMGERPQGAGGGSEFSGAPMS